MAKIITRKFICARDGLVISGRMFCPKDGYHLPVMIVSHGFMANMDSTKGYARKMAEFGYAAFCFDFNGGCVKGKSEGATTEMSVLTEVEDLKAVIRYAKELDITDGSRITLMGCSQGGMVSALTAAELKDEIEKLILFYPAFCIPDDARKGEMMFARFDPADPPEIIRCGPMKLGAVYARDVMEMDVFEAIRPYGGPVLIVHGNRDRIVDVEYSRKARKIYSGGTVNGVGRKQPRKDVVLEIIDGADHGFKGEEDVLAIRFVEQFLQGRTDVIQADVKLEGMIRSGAPAKRHVSIPFGGKAKGIWFHGEIQDGASDEQDYAWGKPKAFAASYTIVGEDYEKQPCTLHIVNRYDGKRWKPEITTDSRALSFLNGADLTAILQHRKKGPLVHIFANV